MSGSFTVLISALCCLLFQLCFQFVVSFPEREIDALFDFYNGTNGINWMLNVDINGIKWNFTDKYNQNPCADSPRNWYGVYCNTASTSVVDLALDYSNLIGTIPASISNLTNLQYFDVTENHLRGTIPNAFFDLSGLEVVVLTGNSFSGTISEKFAALPLTYLYLDSNLLSGTIPASLGNLTGMVSLILAHNNITGSIPSELGGLTNAVELSLSNTLITGTIPPELGNLSNLQMLLLFSTPLNGTIPSSLGRLSNLQQLILCFNQLSGTLPPELGDLSRVTSFSLYNNRLAGGIPSRYGDLTSVTLLGLSNNGLTGHLPVELGRLGNATAFYLSGNYFTGPIPSQFGALTGLTILDAFTNLISGTIPAQLAQMHQVQILNLYDNRLTGPFPSQLGALNQLASLLAFTNQLSGSIPNGLGDCSSLELLWMYGNEFTGTVPVALSNLSGLGSLDISTNVITGSLALQFDRLPQLNTLEAQFNLLSGSIPESIYSLQNMSYLVLNDNFLDGCISSAIGNMTALQTLDLTNNELQGTLPPEMSNLVALEELYLQYNYLTGPLDSFVNASRQRVLSQISLGNNRFTGPVPDQVFLLPSLIVFGAVSNCLSGPLPVNICASSTLIDLILDGVSSSPHCQHEIDALRKDSDDVPYFVTKRIEGSVPSCLFNMTNIELLHLSGNSMTGSIASDVAVSTNLVDLSLSHNQLTGTIPLQLQTHVWTDLDLSFNKLSGVLSGEMQTGNGSTVSLQVNRLSGAIPIFLRELASISVLDGNVFTCGLTSHDRNEVLPAHDSTASRYQCGSNSFDMSVYAWIAAVLVLTAVGVALLRGNEWRFPVIFSAAEFNQSDTISLFVKMLNRLCARTLWGTALLCAVFIPTYTILTAFYHTYTHEYAWTVSAAYLSGTTPGVTLFVLWSLLIAMLSTVLLANHKVLGSDHIETTSITRPSWRSIALLVAMILMNVVFVVGVNVFYVWITLNSTGLELITFVEVLVALFKLVWNGWAVPTMFRKAGAEHAQHAVLYRVLIVLFNNIVAPCAATAAVSPNCFYYVLTSPQQVASSGNVVRCQEITSGGTCIQYQNYLFTTSYLPPFIYSFQCSSTLITNYAAIFVYMFLIDAFAKPLFLLCVRFVYLHYRSNQESAHFTVANMLLPELLKPVRVDYADSNSLPLFQRNAFVLHTINGIAVLLTFGVVFPLLAIVICVDMVVNIFTLRLSISSVLSQVAGDAQLTRCYRDRLNAQCEHVFAMLNHSLWIVVLLAALFYSLFLFDIIGDKTGWRNAIWAPASLSAATTVVYLLFICFEFYKSRSSVSKSALHSVKSAGGVDDASFNRSSCSTIEMERVSSPFVG